MELSDLVKTITNFSNWQFVEKIKFFAWFLHTQKQRVHFLPADIARCFDELNLEKPSSVGPFLQSLMNRKPKEIIKSRSGYSLESRVREKYDKEYGSRPQTVLVHELLVSLPTRLPASQERAYLEEALICFRHKAFRAAVVMAWNLTYDHLCEFVLRTDLPRFNTQLPKTYPKADISSVTKRDDLSVLKESQVLQVCASSGIISGSLHKILKEKLDRRNVAAHPSGVAILEPTAEEIIRDLVENVVLKLL